MLPILYTARGYSYITSNYTIVIAGDGPLSVVCDHHMSADGAPYKFPTREQINVDATAFDFQKAALYANRHQTGHIDLTEPGLNAARKDFDRDPGPYRPTPAQAQGKPSGPERT